MSRGGEDGRKDLAAKIVNDVNGVQSVKNRVIVE